MYSKARIRTTKWQVSPTFSRSSYLVQHSELEHLKRIRDFFSLELSLKNGNTTKWASLVSYSHTGYTHIYGSAEGNSLPVLTKKNKGSFVNVYEGDSEGHHLTKANKSSTDTCILAFTFVICRHSKYTEPTQLAVRDPALPFPKLLDLRPLSSIPTAKNFNEGLDLLAQSDVKWTQSRKL